MQIMIAESIAELKVLYERLKTGMESEGLRVNKKKRPSYVLSKNESSSK